MFMGMSSVNRGKITSTNSTPPTPKPAQHIPVQRNVRQTSPLSRSDLVLEPIFTDHLHRGEWLLFGRFLVIA
jgi:hypothetical protein